MLLEKRRKSRLAVELLSLKILLTRVQDNPVSNAFPIVIRVSEGKESLSFVSVIIFFLTVKRPRSLPGLYVRHYRGTAQ